MSVARRSDALVAQGIRNRIIDELEVAASLEEQLDYERKVPVARVPAETINGWYDWTVGLRLGEFGPPLYTPEEVAALEAFDRVIAEVSSETDDLNRTVAEVAGTPPWQKLMAHAAKALEVMMRRGRFGEDSEADVIH